MKTKKTKTRPPSLAKIAYALGMSRQQLALESRRPGFPSGRARNADSVEAWRSKEINQRERPANVRTPAAPPPGPAVVSFEYWLAEYVRLESDDTDAGDFLSASRWLGGIDAYRSTTIAQLDELHTALGNG